MAKIAFIGLGNMGAPMAANLLKAGHAVTGCDLDPSRLRALEQAGGRAAAPPAAASEGAEAIITMLPAGEQMRAVWLGAAGLLAALPSGARSLLIDCSTIDVATAREVAAAAARAGFDMLDAPVSGGTAGAEAGTLTFMVGGSDGGFARAETLLAAMGRTIVHAGGAGAGQAAKLCNNMILGISMLAVSEAFVLAGRLGLSAEKLFQISAKSSGQCWSLTSYCPVPGPVPGAPANRDYAPGFAASLMLKDLLLAQEAAAASGAATPLGAQAAALYRALVEAGEGGRDFSVAYQWLDRMDRARLLHEAGPGARR